MILRNIPNMITILRLILVVPFLCYLLNHEYHHAFYLFTLAGLSDGIDGFLARRFRWTSQFGSFADPLADKFLMISSFLALTYMGHIPLWFCLLVIVRDFIIMAGVGGLFYLFHNINFNPMGISKINTAVQILLVFSILYEQAYKYLPIGWTEGLMFIVVFTTSLSLIKYVWIWSLKAYRGINV